MARKGLTNGIFDKLEFKPYEFAEFPQHIPLREKLPNGQDYVVVNNAHERVRAMAEYADKLAPRKQDPVTEERDELAKVASEQQAKISALMEELAQLKAKALVEQPTGAVNPPMMPIAKPRESKAVSGANS